MRLLTFLSGVAVGVLLQQSLTAQRAMSIDAPEATDPDDTDTVRPGVGVDILPTDASPVVAGVGVPGDGMRS